MRNYARTGFTEHRKNSRLPGNIDFRDPIPVFAVRKFARNTTLERFLTTISGVFTLVCRKRYRIHGKFGQSIIQKMILLVTGLQNGPQTQKCSQKPSLQYCPKWILHRCWPVFHISVQKTLHFSAMNLATSAQIQHHISLILPNAAQPIESRYR